MGTLPSTGKSVQLGDKEEDEKPNLRTDGERVVLAQNPGRVVVEAERRYALVMGDAGSGREKRVRKRSTANSSPSILMSPERSASVSSRPP